MKRNWIIDACFECKSFKVVDEGDYFSFYCEKPQPHCPVPKHKRPARGRQLQLA